VGQQGETRECERREAGAEETGDRHGEGRWWFLIACKQAPTKRQRAGVTGREQ
jgi:hypothetical protein